MQIYRDISCCALALALGFTSAAFAQTPKFPVTPVRLVIPFSGGSQTDMLGRLVGQKLGEQWGQQVVIDNRPSAGGTIAAQIVASSTPDGHTLFVHSSGFAISPWLYSKMLQVDMKRDFHAITILAIAPQVIVVAPSLGPKNLKDMIALARQKGKDFIVAVPGIASSSHLVTEKLYLEAGFKSTNVWYKGTPECMTDTAAGRTHMSFLPLAPLIPFVREGRLLGLAVSTKARSPVLPDVPSAHEAGLPGFDYATWFFITAPVKTPKAIINKIAADIRNIVNEPAIKERMASIGAVANPLTPEQTQAFVNAEIESLGKIVKAADIKIE